MMFHFCLEQCLAQEYLLIELVNGPPYEGVAILIATVQVRKWRSKFTQPGGSGAGINIQAAWL